MAKRGAGKLRRGGTSQGDRTGCPQSRHDRVVGFRYRAGQRLGSSRRGVPGQVVLFLDEEWHTQQGFVGKDRRGVPHSHFPRARGAFRLPAQYRLGAVGLFECQIRQRINHTVDTRVDVFDTFEKVRDELNG